MAQFIPTQKLRPLFLRSAAAIPLASIPEILLERLVADCLSVTSGRKIGLIAAIKSPSTLCSFIRRRSEINAGRIKSISIKLFAPPRLNSQRDVRAKRQMSGERLNFNRGTSGRKEFEV